MPDPSVKHEEEGIESQLIAHGSSRVVALQERVDRLEVAIARLPRYMFVLGTDVTASCFEGLLDLLLSHRVGSALGGDRELRDSGCESANLGLGLGSIGASGFLDAPGQAPHP